jgi:hypothetical protein
MDGIEPLRDIMGAGTCHQQSWQHKDNRPEGKAAGRRIDADAAQAGYSN